MNAPVSRWGIVEAVSPLASYFAATDAAPAARRPEAPISLSRRVADAIAYVVALPRRRSELAELSSLSDRELADIGLTRSELRQVFRPGFAATRGFARRL